MAVHVSFGLSPALELPRALGCAEVRPAARPTAAVASDADQATSVPGVFAAGEGRGGDPRRYGLLPGASLRAGAAVRGVRRRRPARSIESWREKSGGTVSDRGRGVRSRGERLPVRGAPTHGR